MGVLCLSVLSSCSSQRKIYDSWIGDNKVHLIELWGPPARVASNGSTGEILIFSEKRYNPYTGDSFYSNSMFYADANGRIYRWMVQQGMIPPQQLNLTIYGR